MLHALYLIFNEGYTSSVGPALHRTELSSEAIRLTRAIYRRLPDDPEAAGLLALMLLTDARRPARTGPDGELIPLDKQNRQLWNRESIAEGLALVSRTLPKGSVGPYQLQAAIAAVHDEAPTADETDWPQILALYTVLERMSRQSDGVAQPCGCGRDGARPGRRARSAGSTGRTAADWPGTSPARRRARAPARESRRSYRLRSRTTARPRRGRRAFPSGITSSARPQGSTRAIRVDTRTEAVMR